MSAMATKTKRASDQRHLLDYSKGNVLKICQMKCHLYTKTFPEVLRKYGLMFKRQRWSGTKSQERVKMHNPQLKVEI